MMLDDDLTKVKNASKKLMRLNSNQKNSCLNNIKNALLNNINLIIEKNKIDVNNAINNKLSESMIERLTLDENKIKIICKGIDDLIKLDDVVGEVIETINKDNGLIIEKVRVPFGVIAVIFESRPNVCVDIACLCIKTSNACVLKGGSEAINTNEFLVSLMKNAISDIIDSNVIYFISNSSREITNELLTKREYIDLMIPRGGKNLIKYVVDNSKIPYIETGAGNCHLYVHSDADLDMALNIAINAKYQRPSVCNSIENIIVDEAICHKFLPMLKDKFDELKIEIRADEKASKIINCKLATEDDFYTEYNDYIVSIKVVKNIDEAINHINTHSTKHSEAIITRNIDAYTKFLNEIDSACVYHNASTRFTDGGEFGFGAEIGISTGKLHARGPMGLKEICSYKYKIYGNGSVRK